MPWQLIFTSLSRGLDAGRSGYCTAARSRDLRERLVPMVEKLSAYHHLDAAPSQPRIAAFRIIRLGDDTYFVLSRIQDAGLDYTRRNNYLAHHLIFTPEEARSLPSPAEILLGWKGWRQRWDESPRFLEETDQFFPSDVALPPEPPLPARCWQELAGDAGCASVPLAGGRSLGFRIASGAEEKLLQLYRETTALLPPGQPWQRTFTTFLQSTDNPQDVQWAGLPPRARATQFAQLLDLTAPGKIPGPNDSLAQRARTGRNPIGLTASAPGRTPLSVKRQPATPSPRRQTGAAQFVEEDLDEVPLWRRWLRPVSLALVVMAMLGGGGWGGWQYWEKEKEKQAQQQKIGEVQALIAAAETAFEEASDAGLVGYNLRQAKEAIGEITAPEQQLDDLNRDVEALRVAVLGSVERGYAPTSTREELAAAEKWLPALPAEEQAPHQTRLEGRRATIDAEERTRHLATAENDASEETTEPEPPSVEEGATKAHSQALADLSSAVADLPQKIVILAKDGEIKIDAPHFFGRLNAADTSGAIEDLVRWRKTTDWASSSGEGDALQIWADGENGDFVISSSGGVSDLFSVKSSGQPSIRWAKDGAPESGVLELGRTRILVLVSRNSFEPISADVDVLKWNDGEKRVELPELLLEKISRISLGGTLAPSGQSSALGSPSYVFPWTAQLPKEPPLKARLEEFEKVGLEGYVGVLVNFFNQRASQGGFSESDYAGDWAGFIAATEGNPPQPPQRDWRSWTGPRGNSFQGRLAADGAWIDVQPDQPHMQDLRIQVSQRHVSEGDVLHADSYRRQARALPAFNAALQAIRERFFTTSDQLARAREEVAEYEKKVAAAKEEGSPAFIKRSAPWELRMEVPGGNGRKEEITLVQFTEE